MMTNKETATNKDKTRALEVAITQIEKNFGKGAIMRLGAEGITEGIQVIPTGSLSLDIATGVGGFPRGRVIEVPNPPAKQLSH
jgi:recombination protein RecA